MAAIEKVLSSTILSASGWRKVFALSGNEEDKNPQIDQTHYALAVLMAQTYAEYIALKRGKSAVVVLGTDTRPTGTQLADAMIRSLISFGVTVRYTGVAAAPEIMAYARSVDGFVYISASHNPIGHNGVKFGLNDGGVLAGGEADILAANLRAKCQEADAEAHALSLAKSCPQDKINAVYAQAAEVKQSAFSAYKKFTREVVTGESDEAKQKKFFDSITGAVGKNPLSIVCDFNGSARTVSIDSDFLTALGIGFFSINNTPGAIAHAIIPEPENLVFCAEEMTRLQRGTCSGTCPSLEKHPEVMLGYMPDCDGDRGNIVFWDEKEQKAEVLRAQEVFALSVLAETAYLEYAGRLQSNTEPAAIAVNDATSMRIEEIARVFKARVARCEVGEANVVNLARELRDSGYQVRILGEGSNGGTITYPAAVRDPINTIFALLKLLVLRDELHEDGSLAKKGLFHMWCSLSRQEEKYRDDFTLSDILSTLPHYHTTGVSETRALAKISTSDHARLKANYQIVFEREWPLKKPNLREKWGICAYEAVCNNGTKERRNLTDYAVSGKGGLKIVLQNAEDEPVAFIWMRGSGTEPVFRIMADAKGTNPEMEAELLAWHTDMLLHADKMG